MNVLLLLRGGNNLSLMFLYIVHMLVCFCFFCTTARICKDDHFAALCKAFLKVFHKYAITLND